MTGSPFDGLFSSIGKGIIRSITGREKCHICHETKKIKDMKYDWGYFCKPCYEKKKAP